MLTNMRLAFLWCVLTVGILLMSFLPGSSLIYRVVAPYDANRWVHFLVYAIVIAIPVAAWKRRTSVLLSLVTTVLCISIEFLQVHIPGLIAHPQYALADLFGAAAGILLGSNIRMLYSSAKGASNVTPSTSRSISSPSQTNIHLN